MFDTITQKIVEYGPNTWKAIFVDMRNPTKEYFLAKHIHRTFGIFYLVTALSFYSTTTIGNLQMLLHRQYSIPNITIPLLYFVFGALLFILPVRIGLWQLLAIWCIPLYVQIIGMYITDIPVPARISRFGTIAWWVFLITFAEYIEGRFEQRHQTHS
jgi:hypothetical protein